MLLTIRRLDQFAAEETVDGRIAARLRRADVTALQGRHPKRRQLRSLGVHADVGENEHVRPIGQDDLPPALDRKRSLDEALTVLAGHRRLRVLHAAGVIAEHLEAVAIELRDPTLDADLPYRVLMKEAADNADANRLARR